jgi:hypothetical protein
MVSEPGAPSSFPPAAAAGRVNVDGYRTSIVLYRENIILSIFCNNLRRIQKMNKNNGPGALLAGKRVYNGRYKVKAL